MEMTELYYLDDSGLVTPDYPTVLEFFKSKFRDIYGPDLYLDSDSQDGQWVAVWALALFDVIQVSSSVYNSFSPASAQYDALSRNVKINGIRRRVATYSTVDLRIVGQAGTTIVGGKAEDSLGQKWLLPASVIIPVGGEVTVTATAEVVGKVSAIANSVTKISTPTAGWQTVNNTLPATEGEPIETDSELRRRQTFSTALPSLTVFDGTLGAVASVPGVTRISSGYENDTSSTDANGLPPNSIAIVVEGGDSQAIGDAIATKKTTGTRTFGSTSVVSVDSMGIPNTINFFRPTPATISVEVSLNPLTGYTSSFASQIAAAVADSINNLDIGSDVLITKLYVPANLPNDPAGATYDIALIRIKRNGGSFVTTNINLLFNEVAECDPLTDVTVIVL